MKDHYNVLFLCTGNSARSILAEAILNFKGKPRFTAYSAGSHPSGVVRPEALARLEAGCIPTEGSRSKSWEEFSKPGAAEPVVSHWGVPDPAAVKGSPQEIERAFREAYTILERRIGLFLSLPLASLDG